MTSPTRCSRCEASFTLHARVFAVPRHDLVAQSQDCTVEVVHVTRPACLVVIVLVADFPVDHGVVTWAGRFRVVSVRRIERIRHIRRHCPTWHYPQGQSFDQPPHDPERHPRHSVNSPFLPFTLHFALHQTSNQFPLKW
ncbi:hypothetical protein [Paraburkholderia flagellata]|uniref:hypothetical protein n=1 Tax=Paraburkholderia flagellata TaxID=2883241 RepID=UPI001F22785E|nr:hypothetical protein [Paraburkholderia flagellata]